MYNKRVVIPCEVPIHEVYNIATRLIVDAHKVCPALRSLIKLLIDSLFSHILFSKVLFCSPKEILKNNRTFACNHALLCSVILK